jgi:hypothetical protein
MSTLTPDQVKAITAAVLREVDAGGVTWGEIKDQTIAELCASNQDALIDDAHEPFADSDAAQEAITSAVRTYDELLGTSRASELPAR